MIQLCFGNDVIKFSLRFVDDDRFFVEVLDDLISC